MALRQIAGIKRVIGLSEIQRESGRLRVFVQANAQGSAPAGFVDEIKSQLTQRGSLAPGRPSITPGPTNTKSAPAKRSPAFLRR